MCSSFIWVDPMSHYVIVFVVLIVPGRIGAIGVGSLIESQLRSTTSVLSGLLDVWNYRLSIQVFRKDLVPDPENNELYQP